jgi:hypothetical protein
MPSPTSKRTNDLIVNQGFEKLTGADADKFTLAGNKLTFIAKAFEAGSDNTYRVKIKATVDVAIVFTVMVFLVVLVMLSQNQELTVALILT